MDGLEISESEMKELHLKVEESSSGKMDGLEISESEMKELHLKVEQYLAEFRKNNNMLQEDLDKCIKELLDIAKDMDEFHRKATIANVVGSSVGISGGITSIVGLALTPFTFGASLIVTGIGIGMATAGGVTGALASIVDKENIRKKLSQAEEIVGKINEDIKEIHKISKQMNEALNKLLGIKIGLAADIGGRFAGAAVQIGRLARLVRVITTAARGAEAAAQGARLITALSGVLAGLFIAVDTFFIVTGAIELNDGCKTKEAEDIRALAASLTTFRNELQSKGEELEKELEKEHQSL